MPACVHFGYGCVRFSISVSMCVHACECVYRGICICFGVCVSLHLCVCLSLTGHTVAEVTALALFVKIVAVGVAAAIGEAAALPVDGVVVPAAETGPARPSVRGLGAAGCR